MAATRGSVYFLSHGGPPTMFQSTSAPYQAWQRYGKEIAAARPRGLVVVSAHWENDQPTADVIAVNTDATNPLVYDFYGFPKEFYEQTFESRGDAQLLADIKGALGAAGVAYSTEKRGLDHGVWVPFKVAFDGRTDIPIAQVSLPGDSSPLSAARFGRALAALRDQGYGIMGTGQAVHNLRDLMQRRPTPYGAPFLEAVDAAVKSKTPVDDTINLFRHPLYRQAHPSPEHLLPIVVAAAAADPATDDVNEIFVQPEGALGWGMWSWTPKAVAA
ncbi:hypothetical protein VHUM_01317 [Vanrija humicola]|uniref:Extradiol ring-cleavage dioxygenase class III enzyme subunit B domain-containing protein n=1 Tax=Vanrija humicola TaxID=5417 RepID=A0A7D8Z7M6_VANHU|nr:hypothetical protein VHUM_01317 [Vanrija humicola]